MEESGAEVCVDVEYRSVILNNEEEDAGGCASAGENQLAAGAKPVFTNLLLGNVENSCVMISVLIDDGNVEAAIGRPKENQQRKKACSSAKKPPPHRGGGGGGLCSLDHEKSKMMKEMAEVGMMKRARIERMKALILQKKPPPPPPNYSSFSMLFTVVIVFLIFLLFHGTSWCQISCGGCPPPEANDDDETTAAAAAASFIFIQDEFNPSSSAHHSSAV